MGKPGSSLRTSGRKVAIVTTASLPWMTGTAVNPTLRAAYLAHGRDIKVTLAVPWLAQCDQGHVYPNNITFTKPEEQEAWVRQWLEKRTGFKADFKLVLYAGRYDDDFCSIFPVGDLTDIIPDEEADVAILEEPEHLTWFHHGRRWTDKFKHVVGIMHTNYVDYVRREAGPIKAQAIDLVNRRVCSIHCHKVIKLSDAVQWLPRQTTCFVHGVPGSFLEVGRRLARPPQEPSQRRFSKGAYYIGKVVWSKGYTELLEVMSDHRQRSGSQPHVDVFGNGEDLPQVEAAASKRGLDMTFHGARDHLDPSIHAYQVFLNPSTSDVVATTSCEALAMGKWLICAHHPSNEFFKPFQNCLVYRTPEEFSSHLEHALAHEPHPMSEADLKRLTWEDATERLLTASEIKENEWPGTLACIRDTMFWRAYNIGTGIEVVRLGLGAGRNTAHAPASLADYNPEDMSQRRRFWDRHESMGYPPPRLI